MLPMASIIAYLCVEVLPELMTGRTGRKERPGQALLRKEMIQRIHL